MADVFTVQKGDFVKALKTFPSCLTRGVVYEVINSGDGSYYIELKCNNYPCPCTWYMRHGDFELMQPKPITKIEAKKAVNLPSVDELMRFFDL